MTPWLLLSHHCLKKVCVCFPLLPCRLAEQEVGAFAGPGLGPGGGPFPQAALVCLSPDIMRHLHTLGLAGGARVEAVGTVGASCEASGGQALPYTVLPGARGQQGAGLEGGKEAQGQGTVLPALQLPASCRKTAEAGAVAEAGGMLADARARQHALQQLKLQEGARTGLGGGAAGGGRGTTGQGAALCRLGDGCGVGVDNVRV